MEDKQITYLHRAVAEFFFHAFIGMGDNIKLKEKLDKLHMVLNLRRHQQVHRNKMVWWRESLQHCMETFGKH